MCVGAEKVLNKCFAVAAVGLVADDAVNVEFTRTHPNANGDIPGTTVHKKPLVPHGFCAWERGSQPRGNVVH